MILLLQILQGGRRRMSVQKQNLQVRLKPSTLMKLKEIASSKEESVSEYVRKLLESHLLTR